MSLHFLGSKTPEQDAKLLESIRKVEAQMAITRQQEVKVGDVVQVQAGWAKGQRGTVIDVGESVTVNLHGEFGAQGCFQADELFVLPEGSPEPRRDEE